MQERWKVSFTKQAGPKGLGQRCCPSLEFQWPFCVLQSSDVPSGHGAKAHLFVQAFPSKRRCWYLSGLVCLLDQCFICWHHFSVVEMHPKPSPSELGFSKLEYNSYFPCCYVEKKGVSVFLLKEDCVLYFRLQAQPLLCSGSAPLLSPWRASWLRGLGRCFPVS